MFKLIKMYCFLANIHSLGDRSGPQAGQYSSCTLLLQSHAVVTRDRLWLGIVLLK